LIETDQHHDAGLGGDAGERDEPDGDRDGEVEAQPSHGPQAADEGERQR
jgi:hypothetical protein